jgi:1-pyrroline-5-carboxylate dehydrogenase
MSSDLYTTPRPVNEPPLTYASGSTERVNLNTELTRQRYANITIPQIIGGHEVLTGDMGDVRCPHDFLLRLGRFHKATSPQVVDAIEAAERAALNWRRMSWQDRGAIFLKAAELLTTKYRTTMVAATMLGQSKTAVQAEIDAVCELADFWRFNTYYMEQIHNEQPLHHAPGSWNTAEYRPLEGFVFAVTPFNFTAIGGNLATAPAIMGNVVLWKPASSAVLSSYLIMQILAEAGLPAGVINFVPGSGKEVGDPAMSSPAFAGLHMTGSTGTFNRMWKQIGNNIGNGLFRTYPRIVGETGGKGFVIAALDADADALAVALFRGAFEYQGQKCSAASRAYVPRGLWPQVRSRLVAMARNSRMGDVTEAHTFMGAVIDRAAYTNIERYITDARSNADCTVILGGDCSDRDGFFIEPTVIETSNPKCRTMTEEIFGPVLTVYPYHDNCLDETLSLVNETSPYGLTGAIFARDRQLLRSMVDSLDQAAGNLYINDKPTGAVVGQQPFGGARLSGTNDKAGSAQNLLRWTSVRITKEVFVPETILELPDIRKTEPWPKAARGASRETNCFEKLKADPIRCS